MNADSQDRSPRRYERPVAARLFPRLAQAMDARGMSLADLARAAGVKYQQLVVATSGYRAPSLDLQDRTAAALGMKPHELWQSEPRARVAQPAPRAGPSSPSSPPDHDPAAFAAMMEDAQRKMVRLFIETMESESVPSKVKAQVRSMLGKRGYEVRDGAIVAKHAPRKRPAPWQ